MILNQVSHDGTKSNDRVRGFLLICTTLLAAGCCRAIVDWPATEGVVVNSETGEPISDAIVIANWEGTGGYSQTVCFHSEGARSDNQGWFKLPAWRGQYRKLSNQQVIALAYKKDYGLAPSWNKERILMVPFTGTREERLQYLHGMVTGSSCTGAGASRRNLYPVYKAIYNEARELSVTDEEKQDLNWFRHMAASQAVARDGENNMSGSEFESLEDEFIKENLQ